jgi:sucrose-6-phosphate hydrolase SacC (GH32 family)
MHIFLDSSSIEVFANNGIVVITDLVFPVETFNEIDYFSQDGDVNFLELEAWKIGSIHSK